MKYSLRVIYALDKSLQSLENKYRTKINKFYSDFEKSAALQAVRLRDDKRKDKILLPDSKQKGLDNLLKNYFRDIEKAATDSVKQDLLKHAKTPEERQKILDIKAPKSNKVNIAWAERLAARQSAAFEKVSTEALKDAIKNNPEITASQLKKILKEKTEAYKNLRVENTTLNESNRIQNQVRLEAYKASEMVDAIIFVAVLDGRTTVNCRQKNNTTLAIDDPRISAYLVPQHPRCRSYLTYILKGEKVKLTPAYKVDRLMKQYPVKTLKGMPGVA